MTGSSRSAIGPVGSRRGVGPSHVHLPLAEMLVTRWRKWSRMSGVAETHSPEDLQRVTCARMTITANTLLRPKSVRMKTAGGNGAHPRLSRRTGRERPPLRVGTHIDLTERKRAEVERHRLLEISGHHRLHRHDGSGGRTIYANGMLLAPRATTTSPPRRPAALRSSS